MLDHAVSEVVHTAQPCPVGCTWLRLRKLTRRLTQQYDHFLRPSGLRVTQFSLLAGLVQAGGETVTALAERMAMDRTTLTRNLKPLLQSGLVQVSSCADGRCRQVQLTAAGQAAFDAAYPMWRMAQKSVRQQLGDDMLRELHLLLDDALETLAGLDDATESPLPPAESLD